jgi:protein SCO1/2
MRNNLLLLLLPLLALAGCRTVPKIGLEPVPDMHFTDQLGQPVSGQTWQGKVTVVDFFFTTCPTICPRMSGEMARVHDAFVLNDNVQLISVSIDPEHDTPEVLKAYADRLGATHPRWRFCHTARDSVYAWAKPVLKYALSHQLPAQDASAPGGHVHDGNFILLDPQGYVCGYYDGTNPEKVDGLMQDMKVLLERR